MEKEIDKNVLIGRSEYNIYVSKKDVTSGHLVCPPPKDI